MVPIRNGSRFLADALRSIAAQTRRPDEVVLVVDATSDDDSVELARRLSGTVAAEVVIQDGTGVADAINQGITATHGEAVAMLSCDDQWTPGALAAHEQALATDRSAGYSVGLVAYFVDPEFGPPPGWRAELADEPRRARMIETTMIRRSVFDQIGMHRGSVGASSDVDFFARAHDAQIVPVDVDEIVVNKRVHAASTAHTSPTATADLLAVARDAIRRKKAADASTTDRVAVVIPVRDGAAFLSEALDSVRSQTRPATEIVVVDDGSRDGSARIAAQVPGVRVVAQSPAGQAAARNLGVRSTTSGLIAFLDSDDVMPPGRLETQVRALQRRSDLAGVVGHAVTFTNALTSRRSEPFVGHLAGALMVRRNAFAHIGGFDADLVAGEYPDWLSRARHLGFEVDVVDDVVLFRRAHSANLTRSTDRMATGFLQVARRAIERSRDLGAEEPPHTDRERPQG